MSAADVTEYNSFAKGLSDALEMLEFSHAGTENDVEFWEARKNHGSAQVSIDYVTGDVQVAKFNTKERQIGSQSFTLKTIKDSENVCRFALR